MFNLIYYFTKLTYIVGLFSLGDQFSVGISCNVTSQCEAIENSVCKNNVCQCKTDHFPGHDFNKTLCLPCPGRCNINNNNNNLEIP